MKFQLKPSLWPSYDIIAKKGGAPGVCACSSGPAFACSLLPCPFTSSVMSYVTHSLSKCINCSFTMFKCHFLFCCLEKCWRVSFTQHNSTTSMLASCCCSLSSEWRNRRQEGNDWTPWDFASPELLECCVTNNIIPLLWSNISMKYDSYDDASALLRIANILPLSKYREGRKAFFPNTANIVATCRVMTTLSFPVTSLSWIDHVHLAAIAILFYDWSNHIFL